VEKISESQDLPNEIKGARKRLDGCGFCGGSLDALAGGTKMVEGMRVGGEMLLVSLELLNEVVDEPVK